MIVMNNTHFIDQLSHVNMIETLYLNSNDLKPSMNLFLNVLFKRLLLEYYVYIRTIYNKYAFLETSFLSFQLFFNNFHELFYIMYTLIDTQNITTYSNVLE